MAAIKTTFPYGILNFLVAFLVLSAFSFNLSDARNPLEIFKLKKRMTLSDYNTEIESLDLPTIDAYDPELSTVDSPPLNQDYSSLIAPSPMITNPPLITPSLSPSYGNPRISDPPVYGSSPNNQNPIASPHYGPIKPLPPKPTFRPVGAPTHNPAGSVWCVARPTIQDPFLQQAMDYACGAGADCGPVKPNGSCYVPNTLVAHASYAFNSYWQRTKILGGTCDFGGTAMLITVDPSNDRCQFVYN
ncbi:uncharacterized protein LOC141643644 [Silene latifolia]|uniref:uncharacterized protein LOC141643644 n=1 Tax=Silene latifolia TaxID=37657 RepID=UPI003D76E063